MLGFSPAKSVGSRNKIGYGKRELAEICDAAKVETSEFTQQAVIRDSQGFEFSQ